MSGTLPPIEGIANVTYSGWCLPDFWYPFGWVLVGLIVGAVAGAAFCSWGRSP